MAVSTNPIQVQSAFEGLAKPLSYGIFVGLVTVVVGIDVGHRMRLMQSRVFLNGMTRVVIENELLENGFFVCNVNNNSSIFLAHIQ